MSDTVRITVACPEALISDANNLAMVLAFGPDDAMTYRGLNWQDAQGNLYAAASFEALPEWIIGAQSPLTRPAWDTDGVIDMAAAQRAQARVRIGEAATPGIIAAVIGDDLGAALAVMGLSAIPAPSEVV